MLYLYAITDSAWLPDVPGLDGVPLSLTGGNGLSAVWSEHDQPRLEADETALWEHERVVESLLEQGAVLPMRFGSWLRDQAGVLELLAERRDEFELGLERVRGAVELGVRAMMRNPSHERALAVSGTSRPGTDYMLARLNEEKKSAAIAAYIHEPLVALSRASTPRRTSLTGSVNTAYLVDRDDIAAFRETVEKLDTTVEEATVVCTGPWPPYSFTPENSTQ